MNSIVNKALKGSIYDKKSDNFFEKQIKRGKKYDKFRGDSCYGDYLDLWGEIGVGVGDEWWKD